jgi:hypothetical protein
MKLFLLVLAALCLCGYASAHLCTLLPATQRGGVHDGDFTKLIPGDPTCAAPTAPCNGKSTEEPVTTLHAGQTYDFTIQQNLNHYTVGNPGFIDAAISYVADPQSNDDFEVLPTTMVNDYPAFTEWTQTNFTISVPLDAVKTAAHAVIRFRYVSNKPTEPEAFYSCVDVKIDSASGAPAAPATDAAGVVVDDIGIDIDVDYDSGEEKYTMIGVTAVDGQNSSTLVVVDPYSGHISTIMELTGLNFRYGPSSSNYSMRGYVADSVAAVDREDGVYFLLYGFQEDKQTYNLLEYKYDTDTLESTGHAEYTVTVPCPILSISFDNSAQSLVGLGMQPIPNPDKDSHSSQQVVPLEISLKTGSDNLKAVVVGPAWTDTTNYVDFKDAAYDPKNKLLYGLLWHEDSADSLPFMLVRWNLGDQKGQLPVYWNGTDPSSDSAALPISHFYLDSSSSADEIVGFSPGVADEEGHVANPMWALYGYDLDTRSVTKHVAFKDDEINVAPVSWAGGVAGHNAEDKSLYAMIGHLDARTRTKSVIKRPFTMTAVEIVDGKANVLEELPYIHNLAQIVK